MSIMPYIEASQTSIDQITEFRGLNHNAVIGDNEFYDMKNMSYQDYPAITTRPARKLESADTQNTYYPFYTGSQYYVPFGKEVLVRGSTGVWRASCGYLDIDNYIASDVSMVDFNGDEIVTNDAISASGCEDTDEMNEKCRSTIPPANPQDGALWLDISSYPPKMMRYSEGVGDWCQTVTYMSLNALNAADVEEENWAKISVDDAIEIAGLTTFTLAGTGLTIYAPASKNDFIVLTKIGNKVCAEMPFNVFFQGSIASGTGLHYTRNVKDMDYFFECNNRLWGCKYSEHYNTTEQGISVWHSGINEIYASKLGNPANFNYFANTAIDSYTMSIGSGTQWTGGIAYQGTPIFFKEDCIYRIYGNYPSNYQLKTIFGAGVASGKWKTLTILNDAVYYVGKDGVYKWAGGQPQKISEPLGPSFGFSGFTAGAAIGNKYYLIKGSELYVYNDKYDSWHKETLPSSAYNNFLSNKNGLWIGTDNIMSYKLPSESDFTEDKTKINCMLQTGKIGYMSPFRKYINKIHLKMKLPLTTKCYIEIRYDDEDSWHKIGDIRPTGKSGAVTVPIVPHRCDHFEIKISSTGDFTLFGIYKFYEEGSEYD